MQIDTKTSYEPDEVHRPGAMENSAALHDNLSANCQSEGDLTSLTLSEVIDAKSLQPMMESFHRITGIGCAIVQTDGEVLVAVGWQEICRKFHRKSTQSLKGCIESSILLSQHPAASGAFKVHRCRNGLWEMATPIELSGRHMGNIVIGQFFYTDEKVDPEQFCEQAQYYEFDKSEYIEAFQRVPRFDRKTVEEAMAFYGNLAEMISTLGFSADRLRKSLIERRQAERALQESNQLFHQIAEQSRTYTWGVDLEGLFTSVSSVVELVLGYRPDEIIGKMHLYDLHVEQGREAFKSAALGVFKRKEPFVNLENDALTRDGRIVRLLTHGIPQIDADGNLLGYRGSAADITERKRAEIFRNLSVEALSILIESTEFSVSIRRILSAIKQTTGCDAVGMRLQRDEDFPYFSQTGFSSEFLLKENSLVARDADGRICRDFEGQVSLECTCGLVIRGKTDPSNPLFTKGGSAWTNNSSMLLEIPAADDPRLNRRNKCIYHGYASFALVPIRAGGAISGILQLNSHREGLFRLADIQELEGIAAHIGEALVRKRAEDALWDSEKKHRNLIQNLSVGIVVHASDRRILLFNQVACDILGLSDEQMTGTVADQTWYFVYEDGHRMAVADYPVMRVLTTGKPLVNAVIGVVRPEGEGRAWMLVNAFPQCDERQQVQQVVVTFIDITERKQAEEALREGEKYIKSIFRSAPVGIGVVVNRVLKQVNDRLCEMTGYTENELLNKNSRCLYPDDEAYAFVGRAKYAQIHERGTGTVETRWVRKGGLVFDVLLSSTPIDFSDLSKGVTFTALEITEQKLAEAALRKSEERLRLAMAATKQGWFELNVQTGEVTVSPEYPPMIGYDPADFSSSLQWWLEGIHPDDREAVLERYQICIATGETVSMDYRRLTSWGEWKWIRSTGSIVEHDDRQAPLRMAGTHADITDFKRAEAEKEKLQAQLTQSQKMESVGRLAGGVAHDFNNMLGVILGYTELALTRVDQNSKLCTDLIEVRKAAKRSADLTRQLLAFARRQTVAPKILDLNETIEGMLKMLRRMIGEGINLVWSPGNGVGQVKMDPSQVDQVLANLCVNAQDAIADTGKIVIETGHASFDEKYCIHHTDFIPGDYVVMAVSDNGCGMDKETQANIFEPFFTTKEIGMGTGLGLAMVYGIVKQNGGFINTYSEPGQGTTFRVFLPRHAKELEVLAEPVQTPPVRGSEIILLVEDEPAMLELSMRMLEELGYKVLAANTPREAMGLAREHSGGFDLLMTDVVMPEMNGRDLAKHLLLLFPGIKHLFMSGYTANVIAHHGVLDEDIRYIQKPFSLNDLGAKLREVLDEE